MDDKKLYIIDGHALIYRAYYALAKNPLTNSNGIPTGAIYGFVNYLIRLIEIYKCPYLTVVLDSSVKTFRHEMYEQYKANRDEMPDELKVQIPLIKDVVNAFNIPMICQDGLEADDLIASLTKKAVDNGFDVFLVTKDKDLMQLIGPHVKMLAPDGTGVLQLFDEKDVVDKLGVPPGKVLDYLSLIGDSSDNIPGVPGVGPKTAIKILETAGSVNAVLENPDVIGNVKLIQKIKDNIDKLRISKELVTLFYDAELSCTLDDLKRTTPDRIKSMAFFKEYELHSFMKNPLFGTQEVITVSKTIVNDMKDIPAVINRITSEQRFCFMLITDDLIPRACDPIGIVIAFSETETLYIPVKNKNGSAEISVLEMFRPVFENPAIRKTGYNLKAEYQVLKNAGVLLDGIAFDIMVAAYVIDPGKRAFDIDSLMTEWLGNQRVMSADIDKSRKEKTLAGVTVESMSVYACQTAAALFQLAAKLSQALDQMNGRKLYDEIEIPLITVLAEIEWYGMLIDTKLLKDFSRDYTSTLNSIAASVYEMAGGEFNLNSPKQIGEVLFDKLGLPGAKKTKSGTHSTSFEILENLADKFPVVQKILDYREIQKLLSTYIDALPQQILEKTGRVHSSFNQTVAATGRLSSTNPNLQNIPIRTDSGRRIREAFIAKDGSLLVSADYSQIELRILAHLSNDPFLIDAFNHDQDIHTQTASAIFGTFPEMVTPDMRRTAKTINFGLMYGMGPMNLSRQLGISFGEARDFITRYFAQFPTIKKFMESTIEFARDHGYTETLFGRRRYHPEINIKNKIVREAAERTAINTPVQGTAADIMKIAMINIQNKIKSFCPEAKMILQVHDELVFDVPADHAEKFRLWVIEKMSSACSLRVPLKVEGGCAYNWSNAH
ncbi:MAG: DNA polymerase I [Fibrobacter sp.]|nr:DNA polymerase I [Fibrobacter sp.]